MEELGGPQINSTVSSSSSAVGTGGTASAVNSTNTAEDGGGGRGRNYTSYDIKFKLEAVKYSETHSGVATATQFGVDPKRIRDWRRQKDKLVGLDGSMSQSPIKQPLLTSPSSSEADSYSEEEDEDEEEEDDEQDERSVSATPSPVAHSSSNTKELVGGTEVKRAPVKKLQRTLKTKLDALKYLETHSVNATSRAFKVDPKSIRGWREKRPQIELAVQEELLALEQAQEEGIPVTPRKRIPGAGRKKQEKVIVELSENPNKRHRRSIKLSDKVEIIRLIENGQTQSDVARSLGISQSTVQTIWSNKPEILERNCNPKKKRKNLHWKKYSSIDHSLFTWYRQCRETGVPVDGRMLLDKATEFAEYYKQPDFKGQSIRWVDMFKKRHSISEVDRQDRIQAAAVAAVEQHQQQQQQQHQQIHQHNNNQLHNSNNMGHPTSTTNAHDLVPEFDLSSFPGLMAGLYPPDPTNPSGAPPSSAPPLPVPNFNPHIPIVVTMPVTTCDAMKYVELIRSWLSCTFGENEESLNNHLNAIENAILKRRMTEMLAPQNHHR